MMNRPSEIHSRVAAARTFIFAPGHRPERFLKAAQSGADALILDLEDSVPPAEKQSAREAIEREWSQLKLASPAVLVRINAPDSPEGSCDLELLQDCLRPTAVVIPKAEAAGLLTEVHDRLGGAAVLPIVESAAGYCALPTLAASGGVMRLILGHIDFLADTGLQLSDAQNELAPLRFAIAMHTRINNLASAVDGVTVEISDDQKLRADVERSLHFGFGGKLCIHPRQVSLVHEAMRPSDQEIHWARRVLAASNLVGGAATQLDGKMVDLPVVLQARRTLSRAQADGPGT